MQRTNVYLIGGVVLLMVGTGQLAGAAMALVLLVITAVLAMPVRVVVTSEGAAVNRVVFRPWSEFTSFIAEPRRIVLNGVAGTRPFNLPILATHQKEIIPLLRRHLSEAKAPRKAGLGRRAIAG